MSEEIQRDGALAALTEAAAAHPEMRLGQIIVNASPGGDLFYESDAALARKIRDWSSFYTRLKAAAATGESARPVTTPAPGEAR